MGREIRRVPADWRHPKAIETKWSRGTGYQDVETDHYQPLYDKDFDTAAADWIERFDQWRNGEIKTEGYFWEDDPPPERENYRTRKWTAEEATHYQIYETVTEGTPVSPVFAGLDELVEWCNEAGYWQVWLPDGHAICRRVPDEPITPASLEAAGWHKQKYGGRATAYMKAGVIVHDDPTLTSLLVTWNGKKLPNVCTMQQLAALVTMLGG